MILRNILKLAAAMAVAFIFVSGAALADPADTSSSLAFNPASPVAEGIIVDVTGTVICDEAHGPHCLAVDQPVSIGTIQIQQVQDGGVPVACAELANDGDYETIASGAPNASGQFTTMFDTTDLGGMTIGFRTHFPNAGGQGAPGQIGSDCADLVIVLAAADPFLDGTISYTQGFFGASPVGEDVVDQLIDGATCNHINDILDDVGKGLVIDCSTDGGRDALAFFLTGTVGPGNDDGFLPSGGGGIGNLAAQKIALLLNLNLAVILVDPQIPIEAGYFINIDVVQDLVDGVPGDFIDPVFNNSELYDVCDDIVGPDQICDAGTLDLSDLGDKVALLDVAGTTVEDILVAADDILSSGDEDIDVNGVTLTPGDLTSLLGLINEAYDEGDNTGFVTSFDAD